MKQVWKRRAVVAAVLMLVGTSVYLNWRYAGTVEDSGKKVLGQSALVNGETTDAEVTAAGDEKKIKVPKYVSCSHCNGTGAENGTAYTTCSKCNGSGVVTRVQQTFLGAMQSTTTCPDCGGEGRIITKKCPHCAGEGIVREEEVITLNIPAGVSEGMQLSMAGKGNAARHGGVNGDLLILIEEEPHPDLLRDENDLIYNLLLDLPTAVLGGSIEVPTLDGKARIKVDPGTQPGKIFRLRGKGLPSVNRYGVGDLIVNVSVYIPENLNASEKKHFEDLKTAPNIQPYHRE